MPKETLINCLPEKLGLPERYGKVALEPVVELRLPELARVYDFPVQPETGE